VSESDHKPDIAMSYRQSRREMYVMICVWVVVGLWVLGYNSQAAYAAESEMPPQMLFGMPRWVVFGWLIPLSMANVFTVWFCLRFMKDETMEELPEEE